MNDRQDPYAPQDPYAQQPRFVGYDEYGQPVYQHYDPYTQQQQQQQQQQQPGYGYDPYEQQSQQAAYDPYAGQQYAPQQDYGYDYSTGRQQAVDTTQQWIPQQASAPQQAQQPQQARQPQPQSAPAPTVPEQRRSTQDGYRTEQFSFIEEPDEDSEDVIDWLKFTESRTERREESKRRGRNRAVALAVVLALVVAGGVGYLWYAGMLPGLPGSEDKKQTAAAGPQKRDVIVVHLHNTKKGGTSTALLVDNVTTEQGTTVLLPNSLAVTSDDGTATTLGKSVDEDGLAGTRESLDTVLGTSIGGTWRLDTPYLENLVEQVGTIDIDTDAAVPADKKAGTPEVKKGQAQTLSGPMAVAYATYRAPGEAEAKQLQRFGQVMYGVLRKVPDDPAAATITVQTLAQILDPSLTEKDLGASLAKLAEHAKVGDHKTAVLPVQDDGTLSEEATAGVVKDVLGGTVKSPEPGSTVRVGLKDATGTGSAAGDARVALVNGGYTFVDGGKATARASSQVTYRDAAQKAKAVEVAKTLGLPVESVKQAEGTTNTDVTVVLGGDYEAK